MASLSSPFAHGVFWHLNSHFSTISLTFTYYVDITYRSQRIELFIIDCDTESVFVLKLTECSQPLK